MKISDTKNKNIDQDKMEIRTIKETQVISIL
jgi:hypothetical protein